jgi:small ligand-binding sensory domain FIST
MPFAAALSTAADTSAALEEVCTRVRTEVLDAPDLAMVFFSAHHLGAAGDLARGLRERLAPRCLLGCVAETVVGNGREVEEGPALSLWLGKWRSPVTADPFHLTLERTADGPSLMGWPDALEGVDVARAAVLLLGDPFTFPTDFFLGRVNEEWPGLRVMGGMASGVRGAGECRLLLDDAIHEQGAVGVVLRGDLGLRPIVSQGCRPIGRHLVVTRARDNVILELGGKPPLAQLQDLWHSLNPVEQALFQQGLHVGRVINEYQGTFQRGDFLVRNVIGLDRDSGALAITDRVRVGQTVQFHVRDAATADEDLRALLQLDLHAHDKRPAGALLFSCNGRGTRLFEQPDHDARAVREEAGAIPLAGFFAQGELGPVGGKNFIHGFTASVALFEEGEERRQNNEK